MGLITRRVFLKFAGFLGMTGYFGSMISCGSSGGGEDVASSFQVANGDPDPLLSDSIWCRTLSDLPAGWGVSEPLPPDVFEDPVYRDDGWVWVKVRQIEDLEAAQQANLHLFAGMEGRDYTLDQIMQPSNWLAPDVTWTAAEWENELSAGKVVPVPWYNGLDTETNCPISMPANLPGAGLEQWYLFRWGRDLIQPPWFCTTLGVSLIACVDDSKSTQAGSSITTNSASAQRDGSVL